MRSLTAVSLKNEYRINPLGIDIKEPRFGWVLKSGEKDILQTAYRLILDTAESALTGGEKVLWDTGMVQSDNSVHIIYAGPALESRTRYFWKVKVWDNKGNESEWSETAWFETAFLDSSLWKAAWIEPRLPRITKEDKVSLPKQALLGVKSKLPPEQRLNPPSLLRKEFAVSGPVKRARLYATAHGIYTVELNGRRAGDAELAPGFTPYKKRVDYQTYDVTELLKKGENAVGAVIGDGWWGGRVGLTGDSCQYGNTHAFLMQLEVEYEDGRTETVVSDDSFRCSTGPVRYSDIFIGEMKDARLEMPGWSCAGYDARGWKPVEDGRYTVAVLRAQNDPPIRVIREIPAAEIITTPEGDTVVDLGVNIAGKIRMTVQGAAGTKITLEHSEILNEKGNFINNIAGMNKDQKDIYILKGGETEVFEPLLTYHGFRYVKITGYPGTPEKESFTGLVLSSAMEETGTFITSNENLNKLQANIVRSQQANMISIPTDCPQRERAGWLGDIQVFTPTAAYNANVDAFLTSWLGSVALEQLEDGQVPFIVPYLDAYREQIGDGGFFGTNSSACWGDAAVIVPYVLYKKYGDIRILEKQYDCMKKWMDYIEKTAAEKSPLGFRLNPALRFSKEKKAMQKYLWNTGFHFGDWLIPSKSTLGTAGEVISAFFTKALVAPSYYAYTTSLMAEIAELLGKTEDKTKYQTINAEIKKAYTAYYLGKDGKLKTDLQGIYVLALQFDLVPQEYRQFLADRLVALIHENGDCLDTGFASVAFLLDVLCDTGHRDLAYTLLYQDKCPSWLYEIKNGATTIWESWKAIKPDGKVTDMSYNHYAFGCVGDWMYRTIAGINQGDTAYKRIIIKPQPDGSLTFAKGKFQSVYGEIVSEWRKENGRFILNVTIPCNTTAEIVLPDGTKQEVGSGEYEFGCPV